jgi:hypothetical protein
MVASKPPEPNIERERVLATLRPFSTAWWAVRDEIDAEEHRRINRRIVICRSCFPKENYTASLNNTDLASDARAETGSANETAQEKRSSAKFPNR